MSAKGSGSWPPVRRRRAARLVRAGVRFGARHGGGGQGAAGPSNQDGCWGPLAPRAVPSAVHTNEQESKHAACCSSMPVHAAGTLRVGPWSSSTGTALPPARSNTGTGTGCHVPTSRPARYVPAPPSLAAPGTAAEPPPAPPPRLQPAEHSRGGGGHVRHASGVRHVCSQQVGRFTLVRPVASVLRSRPWRALNSRPCRGILPSCLQPSTIGPCTHGSLSSHLQTREQTKRTQRTSAHHPSVHVL